MSSAASGLFPVYFRRIFLGKHPVRRAVFSGDYSRAFLPSKIPSGSLMRKLNKWSTTCLVMIVGLCLQGLNSASAGSQRSSSDENDWEKALLRVPIPDTLRNHMRRLSARPHHVGSPYDRDNAEWIRRLLSSFGFDVHTESFDVLFPTPRTRVLELVEPGYFAATLKEPIVPGDPTSAQQDEQLPTYNAYAVDGDVTAPLVYVNYGVPDDYEELERLGVSVKGCIVIARYGHSWRGIKPKVAAEHGAIGCIIYSDPHEDGYYQGDVYPQGAWRPREGVQRGSVMDMPIYPGDPLTPGVGATRGVHRLALKDCQTLTKIPVLPVSYGDAQPLLEALGGRVAPDGWRGALPLTYHVGPGPAKVHLKVECSWDTKTINDIIARIPGETYPDEWIVRGNHHDAWVNGAEDPISAQVALLEEARAFGILLHEGWRPKRTIVYCAWDGEEEGLLGSTEWVEEHAADLRQHAVAYINTDGNGRGYLYAGGTHTLESFVNEVAMDIRDPETGLSVLERSRLQRIAVANKPEDRKEIRDRKDLRISALGSGSDYTAFIDHLGIPSLNLGYGGEDGGGIYHSVYDDFHWYTTFSDTAFIYGRVLAQTVGLSVLRLADADLLPFTFRDFSETIGMYVREVKKLLESKREEVLERNRQIREGVFKATNDPRRPEVPPPVAEVPPFLNFSPLENALPTLEKASEHFDQAASALAVHRETGVVRRINRRLLECQLLMTDDDGLPGRPWFKNLIYAPGRYTGYGVKTLPGVREAIEQKHWAEADVQISRVARRLSQMASAIDSTATELDNSR
jgi:N-acetylated-alpha-linked acidic dipeptidase